MIHEKCLQQQLTAERHGEIAEWLKTLTPDQLGMVDDIVFAAHCQALADELGS